MYPTNPFVVEVAPVNAEMVLLLLTTSIIAHGNRSLVAWMVALFMTISDTIILDAVLLVM